VGTKASVVIEAGSSEGATLELDKNGDGDVDALIVSDGDELSPVEIIALLREKITALNTDDGTKNALLNRVDQLESFITKSSNKTDKRATSSAKLVEKKEEQEKITGDDVNEILWLIEQIESAL